MKKTLSVVICLMVCLFMGAFSVNAEEKAVKKKKAKAKTETTENKKDRQLVQLSKQEKLALPDDRSFIVAPATSKKPEHFLFFSKILEIKSEAEYFQILVTVARQFLDNYRSGDNKTVCVGVGPKNLDNVGGKVLALCMPNKELKRIDKRKFDGNDGTADPNVITLKEFFSNTYIGGNITGTQNPIPKNDSATMRFKNGLEGYHYGFLEVMVENSKRKEPYNLSSRSSEFNIFKTEREKHSTTTHASCKDGGGAWVTVYDESPNIFGWGAQGFSGSTGSSDVGIGVEGALAKACKGR